jgi:hypothetical protein
MYLCVSVRIYRYMHNKSCSGSEGRDMKHGILEQCACKLISQSYTLDRGSGNLRTRISWYLCHCHVLWTLSCVPCTQFVYDFPS